MGSQLATLSIKSSKTDQFRHGQVVYIFKSDNDLCPFTAMHQYFKYCRTKRDVLLFRFQSSHPLTWHSCFKHLRSILTAAGYQPLAFNTHSFHIGAATSAAQAGISKLQIKLLGRWHSSAYRRYTRTHSTNHSSRQPAGWLNFHVIIGIVISRLNRQPAAWLNSHAIINYYCCLSAK